MDLKESLVLCFLVTMIMIEPSSGAPPSPPPSPSGSFTCLTDLMLCQGQGGNSSTPSTACCSALKRVNESEKTCLCLMLMTENATSLLGMNGTQLSDLLVKCDILNATTTTTTFCNATSPFSAPLPFTPGSPFLFLTPPGSAPPPAPSEASVMYNQATWVRLPGLPCFLILFIFLGWI